MPTKEKAEELFARFLRNECTEEETEQLMQEFAAGNNIETLKALIRSQLEDDTDQQSYAVEVKNIYEKIEHHIRQEGTPRQVFLPWKRMAIAASLILLMGAGAWFFITKTPQLPPTASHPPTTSPVKDFAPGGEKATLTLANGEVITLDSARNGKLSQQGNTSVLKLSNGELTYASKGQQETVFYNTITTPRGGQYEVTLSDGTKVWLNAASSLRAPTAFTGNQRTVEVKGEVYFEVAQNASMPFVVRTGNASIKVLGTHFNINAYPDETEMNVTLLEGKVTVASQASVEPRPLLPGQQARVNATAGHVDVLDGVNLESVMAWKNNLFYFNNADIKTIMRQISRWYDIDVAYEGKAPTRAFSGKISRNTNASNVLKILEQSGIHFRMEAQKIIVTL